LRLEARLCEERVRECGLLSLWKGRLWGDLTGTFQYLQGGRQGSGARLITVVCGRE